MQPGMTLLKRLITAAVIFCPLFVVLYLGTCGVCGAIAGGKAAIDNPDAQDKRELGREAGGDIVTNNLGKIVFVAFAASFASSMALSFSGIFPWCRNPPRPPPLPQL